MPCWLRGPCRLRGPCGLRGRGTGSLRARSPHPPAGSRPMALHRPALVRGLYPGRGRASLAGRVAAIDRGQGALQLLQLALQLAQRLRDLLIHGPSVAGVYPLSPPPRSGCAPRARPSLQVPAPSRQPCRRSPTRSLRRDPSACPRGEAGDVGHHRLLHVRGDVLGGLLLGRPADLAGQHDQLGLLVCLEQLDHIHERAPRHRVATPIPRSS